jgi:uncharacterized protein (DUF433 family)
MAHDTVDYKDHIVRGPDVMVGKPVVKGTRIPVERVLAKLAVNLDVEELLHDYPDLTRDDVRAVLSYAHDRIHEEDESTAQPHAVSPAKFYVEITKRPDVSELMRRLAR